MIETVDPQLESAPPCPICGKPCPEVIAAADDVAHEIALRSVFFRRRLTFPARRDADRRDISHVAFGDPAAVMRCPSCDVYVRASDEDSEALFADDRYDERTLDSLRRFHAAEFSRKKWAEMLLPPGARVLEVGSYVGGFLEAARSWGWQATGIDIGTDTARFTRDRGDDVIDASLDDVQFTPASFDGIFIWNCFEQLPDPPAALTRCRELLRPSGVLVIRIPDARLYVANRARPTYLAYSNLLGFPHRFGFTEESLDRICAAAGFRPESSRHDRAMRPHREAMTAWAQEEESRIAPQAWLEAAYRANSDER